MKASSSDRDCWKWGGLLELSHPAGGHFPSHGPYWFSGLVERAAISGLAPTLKIHQHMKTVKLRPLVSSMEVLEARIAPATIYAVDVSIPNADANLPDTQHLISFDSATPGTIVTKTLTGFVSPATESIRGIDFRPATGDLYALGIVDGSNDTARLYKLNPATATLTEVGTVPFSTTLNALDDYAFDVNPVLNQINVVGDTGNENLRVDPNTGALISTDTAVTGNTQIDGVAFSNNFEGASTTILYGISKQTAHLVTIGSGNGSPLPFGGVVTPAPNPLGFTPSTFKIGFDIENRTGIGYVVMTVAGTTGLYTVDLTSGIATSKGTIGNGTLQFEGMSVALPDDLKIVNATTATYVDRDGDNVTVKITGAAPGASLAKSDFRFSTGQFGSQLESLDLSNATHLQEWSKASISINAVPAKTGTVTRGDSFVNVGYINATGVDLGAVIINGDLGQIDAGDATTTTPGLASLTTVSMGAVSNSQLPSGGVPDQKSDIFGKLGSLTVKGDFTRELISVTGAAGHPEDGAIGNITITGDVIGTGFSISSGITASGAMGNILIKGDIIGGSAAGVGSIIALGNIGTVTLYGSLDGGSAMNAGALQGHNIGNVVIKGSIYGGTHDHTGIVEAGGILGNVTIGGSIVAGIVPNNGDLDSGVVFTNGPKMGNVTVGGSLEGSNSAYGGSLFSAGTMGNVTIGGSVKGGSVDDSASIVAAGNIGAVKIGGDLTGGGGEYAGSIETYDTGSIASVTVLGNVTGSYLLRNGIISANQLGAVKILGSLESLSVGGVRISAEGDSSATKTARTAAAIASISITGSVRNALILGGYDQIGRATNPDATIGAVTVGQNWIATQLVVGVKNLGGNGMDDNGTFDDNLDYGNGHDTKITANDSPDTTGLKLISKIASVTIKGYAIGTVSTSDNFGIVAQQVGLVKVGVRSYPLATGTDLVGLPLGATADFFVHEVA